MSALVRTGISMDRELLDRFDRAIAQKGYRNRSEAIRDLVRDHAVSEDISRNRLVVGTLTLVYDHRQPGLSELLLETQHHFGGKVLAVTHVHLDSRYCLEVIIFRGRAAEVKRFSDGILSIRGVKHGKLVMTTPGGSLA